MATNENEFMAKFKRLCNNRAVIVTVVTLLVATGIIIAVTVSANRTKRPAPGGTDTTESITDRQPTISDTEGNDVIKDETIPTFNGGEETPDAFTLPVTGKLQKAHDTTIQVWSNTMGDYRVHVGLDIATAAEAPVYAAADGKVERVWNDALMGQCVALTHENDTVTVYKNLSVDLAEGVAVGATVKQGQQLGIVGDTATLEMADEPHLHFEMTVKGLSVNPLDYFSKAAVESLSKDTAFESGATETSTSALETTNGK